MGKMILITKWGETLKAWIDKFGLGSGTSTLIYNLFVIALTIVVAYGAFRLVNYVLKHFSAIIGKENKSLIQSSILKNKVLKKISYYLPLIVIYHSLKLFLIESAGTISFIDKIYNISLTVLFVIVFNAILKVFVDISQYKESNRSKPIKGLVQFLQIIIYFFAFIICLSLLISKEPSKLVAGLGAASAVIMLIFKDSITGLVAGIQLSFNKMIKIGDWIEVPKYGVDGEVIDITITSVKVQNWDKTISTIPAYNLIVSDSIKNWEGMSQSGGRRIARTINIDMRSVKFCTPEILERFRKIQYVSKYIAETEKEIDEYNKTHDVDNSLLVNGRRQTNLGVFRAYLIAYLKSKKDINHTMTLMVRQMQPTDVGIPLQIYCFTATTQWALYESIQADVFDHILAVLPEFELNVFQSISGTDLNKPRI